MPGLTPELLLSAYAAGVFPMAEDYDSRAIALDRAAPARRSCRSTRFHVPRSLRKAIRRGGFEIRVDTAFERSIRACAAPTPARPRTWLNERADRALRRAAPPRPRPQRRDLARRASWSAGSTALRAGRRVLRREHVLARAATPARSPWSTWSTGCAPAASCCSTRSSSPTTCSASARSRSAAPAYLAPAAPGAGRDARASRRGTYPFAGGGSRRRPAGGGRVPAAPAPAPAARRSRPPRRRRPGARARTATGWRRTSSRVNAVFGSRARVATLISRKAALSGGSVGGVSRQARGGDAQACRTPPRRRPAPGSGWSAR